MVIMMETEERDCSEVMMDAAWAVGKWLRTGQRHGLKALGS
jgi:hypothetical protein